MKWKVKKAPVSGQIRYVKKFYFLPTKLSNLATLEDYWVWLESVIVREDYKTVKVYYPDLYGGETRDELRWVTTGFVEE
jgi:hypothetical protein